MSGDFSELLLPTKDINFVKKDANIKWIESQKRFLLFTKEKKWYFILFSSFNTSKKYYNSLYDEIFFPTRKEASYAALSAYYLDQQISPFTENKSSVTTEYIKQEVLELKFKKFNQQTFLMINPANQNIGTVIGQSGKWKFNFLSEVELNVWHKFYDLGFSQLEISTFKTRHQIVEALHQVLANYLPVFYEEKSYDYYSTHDIPWWQPFVRPEIKLDEIL